MNISQVKYSKYDMLYICNHHAVHKIELWLWINDIQPYNYLSTTGKWSLFSVVVYDNWVKIYGQESTKFARLKYGLTISNKK